MTGQNTLCLYSKDVTLLEHVRTPVVVIESGLLRYVNPSFCSLFDKAPSSFINHTIKTIFHERCRQQVLGWMESSECAQGEELKLDLQLALPNDKYRWLNGKLVSGTWDDKPAIIGFLVDIEEKKKNKAVEEQLRQSQKMEAVGRLAGGVAHDMNNMLGAIMGFASVMQAEMDPGSSANDDINHILEACKKGRDLMLNLLGFARRGKYRLERFTLDERVTDVINLLKHSIPKKIRIKKNIVQKGIIVHGDPTQIHHALMNLCLNAVDSIGESGTITIDVDTVYVSEDTLDNSQYAELEPGEYAKLSISDTGSGMDSDVIDMAFEPFFTTKPIGQGSGLGLPMVYGTVKNHGGAVILESRPNHGTVVTMLLPLSNREVGTTNTLNERRTPSDLSIATILLIDDEEMIRQAGKRLLSKLGYRVLVARDGKEGLRTFVERKNELAAVMLDLMMPVMDGEETLIKMKEIDPEIPVLLSSGYSKEEKAEQLLAKGANGFIQKPFDMKTLKSRLNDLIE